MLELSISQPEFSTVHQAVELQEPCQQGVDAGERYPSRLNMLSTLPFTSFHPLH
jgi:hypothetical protein